MPWVEGRRRTLTPATAGMLRAARERRGITRRELAARIGASRQTIDFLETAKRTPSRLMAAALADALRLDPAERARLEAEAVAGAGRDARAVC